MKRRLLYLCVFLLSIIRVFYPSSVSVAIGVVEQGEVMEESSVVFSDANSSLIEDDFVIPILTTYSATRSVEVTATEPTEAELLNTRQTISLSERQSMCAAVIVEAMRDYKNTVGVNVLKYALTSSEIKEVYATIRNTYPEFFIQATDMVIIVMR